MNKNFERTLPEGYKTAKTFDMAKDKKAIVIMNVANVIILVAAIALFCAIYIAFGKKSEDIGFDITVGYIVGFIAFIPYIVLHELVHGLAYKLLTKEKLTYGMSFSCAYCGVPKIYTYRRTALIAVSAPLILFTLLFAASMVVTLFFSPISYFAISMLCALHLGGCVGDIYVIYLFTRKFKDSTVLMNDTGPKMTLYTMEEKTDGEVIRNESN